MTDMPSDEAAGQFLGTFTGHCMAVFAVRMCMGGRTIGKHGMLQDMCRLLPCMQDGTLSVMRRDLEWDCGLDGEHEPVVEPSDADRMLYSAILAEQRKRGDVR